MFWVGLGWVGLVKGSVEYGYGYESEFESEYESESE